MYNLDMSKNLIFNVSNSEAYTVRSETLNGRQMIVVPAVIMVEGVHHGSGGPIYHNPEIFSQYASLWNGVPIPIDHPRDADGIPISANSPGLSSMMVGTVYNAHYDSSERKLKAEMWLDLLNVMSISPDAYAIVMNGDPLDLSHGGLDVVTPAEGDWNGERYVGYVSSYSPDHVALLPNAQGACNFDDGCGIRTNSRGGENNMSEVLTLSKAIVEKGSPWKVQHIMNQIVVNTVGLLEVANSLQRQLDGMDDYPLIHYLEELYDSTFIYRVNNYDTKETQYFRQNYSVNSENAVELKGDAVRVYKEVSYLDAPVTNRSEITNDGDDQEEEVQTNSTQEVDVMPCSCEKADKLISLNVGFAESDKSQIEKMPEDFVDRLIANAEATIQANEEDDSEGSGGQEEQQAQGNDEDGDDSSDMSVNEAIKVLKERVSPEQFEKLLSQDTQDMIAYNRKINEERKKKLVVYLDDKTKQDVYSRDQLDKMSIQELDNVAKLVGYKQEEGTQDYSPLGNVPTVNVDESGGDETFLNPGKHLDS